jgi:hypothetical protein
MVMTVSGAVQKRTVFTRSRTFSSPAVRPHEKTEVVLPEPFQDTEHTRGTISPIIPSCEREIGYFKSFLSTIFIKDTFIQGYIG